MKENSYEIVHLNGGQAKKLSQVLSNETSKRILDHLSKRKATESDIAKDLALPLSTVHYNLKLLEEAHMVVADEYHYSQKGKVVNHYSLSNKLVVIAPVQTRIESIRAKMSAIVPAVLVSLVGTGLLYYFTRPEAAPFAEKTAADAAPRLMDAASQEAVTVAPGIMQQAWPWFLIGATIALVVYVGMELLFSKN